MKFIDTLIGEVDNALRTLLPPKKRAPTRISPAETIAESLMTSADKKHVAGLMRVNHAGEVCAQALYQGQALTARLANVKEQMNQAAAEEIDHLAWCEERLAQLNSQPSVLNPIWYSGSLVIGALAGFIGDKVSLGFVAETERQVTSHLQKHIALLPKEDNKTKAILERMQDDEEHHANLAMQAGAKDLPFVIKTLMAFVSKGMTKTSYYI